MNRRALWAVWRLLPAPLRGPAHGVVAAVRRGRARSTPLPSEPGPPLPEVALELPTRYGSFWFDGTDEKIVPWIRRHGTWEADVVRLLGRSVRPGSTVVDVGANVGFHTVLLSKLVGPTGAVHAFEPMPETVELLRANIWRHGCTNTAVHPSAVADQTGTVLLEHNPAGSSGARLAASGIAVGAVTLDGVLGSTRVDILKVDVEGAERSSCGGRRRSSPRAPGCSRSSSSVPHSTRTAARPRTCSSFTASSASSSACCGPRVQPSHLTRRRSWPSPHASRR